MSDTATANPFASLDQIVYGRNNANATVTPAPVPANSAQPSPAIEVSGAASTNAPFAGTPGYKFKIILPSESYLAKYAGQTIEVPDASKVPAGIKLPANQTFPMKLQFGHLPDGMAAPSAAVAAQPQTFPVVNAPAADTTLAQQPAPVSAPASLSAATKVAAPDASSTANPFADLDKIVYGRNAQAKVPAAASGQARPQTASSATAPSASTPTVPTWQPDAATGHTISFSDNAPATDYGILGNIGARGNEAVARTLGAPVDLTTGALNLGIRGVNAASGANIPPIQNPVGGSGWVMDAMGKLGFDPRTVQPQTLAEDLAGGAAGGAVSAVLPIGIAGRLAPLAEAVGPVTASVTRTLAEAPPVATGTAGAASGVGGNAAVDAARHDGVPDQWLPYIDMAAQLITGAGAAGAAGLATAGSRAARDVYGRVADSLGTGQRAPLKDADGLPIQVTPDNAEPGTQPQTLNYTPRQVAIAGQRLVQKSGLPSGELTDSIPTGPTAVPGSVPPAGAAMGNVGLLQMERDLKNTDPAIKAMFNNRYVAMNNAQLAHLRSLAPDKAQAQAAGYYYANRMQQLDAQADAATEAAHAQYEKQIADADRALEAGRAKIEAEREAANAQREAESAKSEAERQAALEKADAAVAKAKAATDAAAEAIGGNRQDIPGGQTAREYYGDQYRNTLQKIRNAENAHKDELYEAARDAASKGALKIDPLKTSVADLKADFHPEDGEVLGPGIQDLFDVVDKMPDVIGMDRLARFRKSVRRVAREARAAKNRGVEGAADAERRASIILDAVDRSVAEAVARAAEKEAPAIAAGAPPAATVVGRLAEHASGTPASAPNTESAVYLPSGKRIDVRYKVVDASGLQASNNADMSPNAQYPKSLQPRDRTRAASNVQVQRIAGNLQPERLGASTSATEGAPIVGPDGVVESGNARLLGVRLAYAESGDSAAAYRAWLEKQGYSTKGMKEPVLVRERTTPLSDTDRIRFTQEANAAPGLAMSASERAAVDAQRLPDHVLSLYRGGDVGSAANRDFVRAFSRNVVDPGEEGSFTTRDGSLSQEGTQRVRNALLHSAYGEGGLVAALAESGDDNIKAFGGALMDAAGSMARLRAGIQSGDVSNAVDLSGDLASAARAVAQARARGISLRDMVAQQDVLGGGVSQETAEILRTAYGENLTGRLSRAKFASLLEDYAAKAMEQTTQARLFGENATRSELLEQAAKNSGKRTSQASSKKQSPSAGDFGAGNAGNGGQARRPVDASASEGNTGATGSSEGPRTENLTAEQAARFKAADAFNREFMAKYGPKTETGAVLAKGPGGDYEMASHEVVARYWRKKDVGAEMTNHLIDALGSREKALEMVGDHAAFDLKAFAKENDGLSAVKLQKWQDDHSGALNTFPELREKFGTLTRAQKTLDDLKQQRADLEKTLAAEEKERVRTATQAQKDLEKALSAREKGLVSDRAEVEKTLALQEKARVRDAATQRADFLKGVARHYLTKGGEPIKPEAHVESVLGSPTGPADMAQIVREMRGDPDAIAGLRQIWADWIAKHVTNTAEAGVSGERELSAAKLENLVKDKSKMAVLRQVFTPEQVKAVVEAVAADAQTAKRAMNATKLPGSPGSAADYTAIHGIGGHGDVTGALAAEALGEVAGHLAGLRSVLRPVAALLGLVGRKIYGTRQAANKEDINHLTAYALLHPDVLRAVVAAARQPVVRPSILKRLVGMFGALAVSGATAPPARGFAGAQ